MEPSTRTIAASVAVGAALAWLLLRRRKAPAGPPAALTSDPLPNAPAGTAPGPSAVGVRTVHFTLPGLPADIIGLIDANPAEVTEESMPRKPRSLVCEIWYPANASPTATTEYPITLGNNLVKSRPVRPGRLVGRATRDAPPLLPAGGRCPVVIVSHGMSSHRYMAVGLVEWLATHGYVVIAIEHAGSTNRDVQKLGASAFWHNPLDVRAVAAALQGLLGPPPPADDAPFGFLRAVADPSRLALVGHSMGGYGALSVAGMRPHLSRSMRTNPTVKVWRDAWAAPLEATAPEQYAAAAAPPPGLRGLVLMSPYGGCIPPDGVSAWEEASHTAAPPARSVVHPACGRRPPWTI